MRAWSNLDLDMIEGTALLLNVYEARDDSYCYRLARQKLSEDFVNDSPEIVRFATTLKTKLTNAGFGTTSDTNRSALTRQLFSAVVELLSVYQKSQSLLSCVLDEWEANENITHWWNKFFGSFLVDSSDTRLRVPVNRATGLGPLDQWLMKLLLWFSGRLSRSCDLGAAGLEACARYMMGMVDLCWESGLKSALAPVFLILNDLTELTNAKSQPQDPDFELAHSLLSTLFPETPRSSFTRNPSREVGNTYPEWDLVGSTIDELVKLFGSEMFKDVRDEMKSMGYESGHKWNEQAFHLLFERLYMKPTPSLVSLAGKYDSVGHPLSLETVSRQTIELSDRLGLDRPPHAPRIAAR